MYQIPFKLGHKQTVLFFENLQEEQVSPFLGSINKMKKSTLDQKQMVPKNFQTY